MGTKFIHVECEGKTCILTIRRPEKLNALSTEVERDLLEVLDDDTVRMSSCLIITGNGRAFSVGADLMEFRRLDPASVLAYYRDTGEVYERLAARPEVTISAITGYCLGGGFEIALATDFRIAEENAVFGFPEISLGIVPTGGAYRITRLVGPGRAKEILLLRPRMGAAEAKELGIVNDVVPPGEGLARALEVAARLAELPPLAASLAKQTVDRMPESSRETAVFIERLAYGMLAQTEDAREAADAFVEKREPHFKGR